ncbi:cell division protein CrgA [Georgenia deserti]|uniref:Cell division protein CrgA n=1 Tax=Georgenia deserti TaxID=2093781 RepID=A0ABW4L6P7_9MICO|nr:cell division protein CrgA [Micromonosporaceae bacterium]
MPEPKKRKKPTSEAKERPAATKAAREGGDKRPRKAPTSAPMHSPRWWAPTMVTLMVIGLICVVLTYLLRGEAPVPGIGNWNLAIGFGVMLIGFFMTLKWR